MRRMLPLAALLLPLACATVFDPTDEPEPDGPLPRNALVLIEDDTVKATGAGVARPGTVNLTQQRAESRDLAIAEAREKLTDYLEGLVPSKRKAQAAALALSAEILYTHWEEDGSATAVLRLSRERINQALGTDFR